MFRNTFQKGFLSVFYSIGRNPLMIWDMKVQNGRIKRITDNDCKSLVLEIMGLNVATCFITAPAYPSCSLGIKLPFLSIIVKNMQKYFSFEVQILDDRQQLRRFRISNYQSASKVDHFSACMPLAMNCGWNQIQMNLADFTRRAFATGYVETVRIQISANCRLRNIFFSDRLYSDDEKPAAYKIMTLEDKRNARKLRPERVRVTPRGVEEKTETLRPSSPEINQPIGLHKQAGTSSTSIQFDI